MSAPVTLSGFLRCASDAEASRVSAHLPEHVELSRAEPGCEHFEVLPTADPWVWSVSERFTNRATFEAHQARVASSDWGRATVGIEREYTIS